MKRPRFSLEGDIGEGKLTATALAEFLSAYPEDVDVYVNSRGGVAMEGAAMMAEIERHGRVTIHVQGVAASAATLPVVAARTTIIHPAAFIMIHEPSQYSGGTADDHRETAASLDKLSRGYAEAYAKHTGHPVERIASWLKAETWLSASEAVALGFCDHIEGDPEQPIQACAGDYSRFRFTPPELLKTTFSRSEA